MFWGPVRWHVSSFKMTDECWNISETGKHTEVLSDGFDFDFDALIKHMFSILCTRYVDPA
jgi:hypothetical protein